eukprot:jgi/Mesen1/6515/ME000332S05522
MNVVKQQAFYMKRALDNNNMREALKFSAGMLSELRTSRLSPQKYYVLCGLRRVRFFEPLDAHPAPRRISLTEPTARLGAVRARPPDIRVFDELQQLEACFREENRKGRSCADLYEIVQHAGNILPRLGSRFGCGYLPELADNLATVLPEFLQVDAFNKLSSAVSKVVDAQPDMPLVGAVSLYVALLQFVLRVHSDRLDYVDNLLKYNDVVTLLRLAHYPRVMDHLDYGNNKVMAVVIIQSVLKRHTLITDADKVEALLQLLKELIHDSDDAPPRDELDEDDFAEEQNLIARLVHVLANDDPDAMFKMLSTARKHFGQGGPSRLLFTLPPIVFSSLKLVRVLMQGEPSDEDEGQVTPQKIFQFLFKTVEVLVGVAPELAFRLYLQCAEAASECALEPLAYDFFTQAFILYEEEIADSKAQVTALQLIVGTLQRTSVFGADNRDTLTHKATGYSAKLLKKADQCRAVCACSHLFWPASSSSSSSSSSRAPAVDSSPSSSVPTSADADSDDSAAQGPPRDGERVVLCLKRALRIANAAQQMASASRGVAGSVALFVEILNKYLYYFDQDNPHVTDVVIQGLIELVNGEMQSESITCDPAVDAFYDNTLQHIKDQKLRAGAIADKYSSIQV